VSCVAVRFVTFVASVAILIAVTVTAMVWRMGVMKGKAICPICNEPAGEYRPGAKVYHLVCMHRKFRPHRLERAALERERNATRIVCNG